MNLLTFFMQIFDAVIIKPINRLGPFNTTGTHKNELDQRLVY